MVFGFGEIFGRTPETKTQTTIEATTPQESAETEELKYFKIRLANIDATLRDYENMRKSLEEHLKLIQSDIGVIPNEEYPPLEKRTLVAEKKSIEKELATISESVQKLIAERTEIDDKVSTITRKAA